MPKEWVTDTFAELDDYSSLEELADLVKKATDAVAAKEWMNIHLYVEESNYGGDTTIELKGERLEKDWEVKAREERYLNGTKLQEKQERETLARLKKKYEK